MQDIQSPFGPTKGHGATPKTYIVTTPQQLFNVIHQWLNASEQAKTLKNFQDVIEVMMSKIHDLINQRIVSGMPKAVFAPLPDALKKEFEQAFLLKWDRGKSLNEIIQNLNEAVRKQNVENATALLTKFTNAQVDKDPFEVPSKLQQAVNEALEPLLKDGLDESLLKLYLMDLGAKHPGLQNTKEAVFEKLQKQLLTMPNQQTPFHTASAKILSFLKTPEGERMLVMLVGGEQAVVEKEKVKNSLKALAANESAKKSLQSGAKEVDELASEASFENAQAEDVASKEGMVYLKQIIDPAFEQQINALKNILDILAKAFPGNTDVASLIARLGKISADYQAGTLDYTDLTLLETSSLLSQLINKIPDVQTRLTALIQLMSTLTALKSIVTNGDKALSDAIAQLQNKINFVQSFVNNLNIINTLLQQVLSGGSWGQVIVLSQEDYKKMETAYLALLSQMPNLSPEDQKAITGLTDILKAITATGYGGNKSNMFDIMAFNTVYALIKKYATDPNFGVSPQNMAALQKELHDLVANLKNQAKTNPALQPYADALAKFDPIDFSSKGPFGTPLFYGNLVNLSALGDAVYDNFPTSVKNGQNALSQIIAKISQGLSPLQAQLAALQNSASQLAIISQQLSGTIDEAIRDLQMKMYVWTHSLPDDFNEIIINRFMPAQEAKLWALANLLAYYNMNASQDNQFIKAMKGWDLANTDFSCGLNSPITCYTNEYNNVKERLNQIDDPDSGLIRRINDAKTELDKSLKKGDITQQQYDDRLKTLNTDLTKLNEAKAALSDIEWRLRPASQSPPVMPTAYDLGAESRVKRALTDFYGYVDSDATNFTSLGQRQQMTLQLTMTQIQQEWTVVTTCMQMLNQMYMTLARGISQH